MPKIAAAAALTIVLFLCGCSHCSSPPPAPAPLAAKEGLKDPRITACERVLLAQAAAWNRGDMAGYAAAYHESPATLFTSGSGTTLGYQALLTRMREHYPDKAAMGHLSFAGLNYTFLSDDEILVVGAWKLSRQKDKPWGRFVLVMRKVEAGWRVVLDYTNLGGK